MNRFTLQHDGPLLRLPGAPPLTDEEVEALENPAKAYLDAWIAAKAKFDEGVREHMSSMWLSGEVDNAFSSSLSDETCQEEDEKAPAPKNQHAAGVRFTDKEQDLFESEFECLRRSVIPNLVEAAASFMKRGTPVQLQYLPLGRRDKSDPLGQIGYLCAKTTEDGEWHYPNVLEGDGGSLFRKIYSEFVRQWCVPLGGASAETL